MKKLITMIIGGALSAVSALASMSPTSVSPNSGTSMSQQFTIYFTGTQGANGLIGNAGWLLGGFGTDPNKCRVQTSLQTGEIRLYNENGVDYISSWIGVSGTMSNGHCIVNPQTSWQYATATQAWLAPDITFTSQSTGVINLWAGSFDTAFNFNGYVVLGSWTVGSNVLPTVALSSPTMGASGSFARFTISTSGANQGWTALQISPGPAGWGGWSIPGSCDFLVYPNGTVYIGNDAQNAWTQPVTIGTQGTTISNSQCKLNVETSQFVAGSTNVWALDVAFTANFIGTKTVMGLASTTSGSYAANPTTFGGWTINETSQTITSQPALQGALTIDDRDGVSMVHVPSSSDQYAVVKLRHGGFHMVARANNVHISKINSAREPVGQNTTFRYKLTCPDCYLFRMGINEDIGAFVGSELSTTSKVHHAAGFGWSLKGDATAPTGEEEYSITSSWKPGLMPMYFVSRAAEQNVAIPYTGRDAKAILDVSNIFVNSQVRYVIGPAIKPDATKEELVELVGRWVDLYGFDFLKPIVDAGSLEGIDALTVPDDDLSRDIVKCLKGVMLKP